MASTLSDMVPGVAEHSAELTDAALDRLRRGAVEYCVLTLLRSGPAYSHDVVRALGSVPGLVTSEGTVYPLLSRLRRDGLVDSRWQESPSGPPRRYYELTPEGERVVVAFAGAWRTFRAAVDAVLASEARGTEPSRHRSLPTPHEETP